MTDYLTIVEARKILLDLTEEFNDEPLTIKKQGKPLVVTTSYRQIGSLLETLDVLQDESFRNHLATGIAQAEQGETIAWD